MENTPHLYEARGALRSIFWLTFQVGYTEWSVMCKLRTHILWPQMLQALLVRLRGGCSGVGTLASPAVRGHGSALPRLLTCRQTSTCRQPFVVTERWSRLQSYPCFARVILDFSAACLLSVR